jgi:uncharacterized iron-regulated membrane protein
MQSLLVTLHRWLGLASAVFLLIAGLTGAIISWDHELDEWLNPHLHKTTHQAAATRAPLDLVTIVEKADPRVRVSMFPLHYEAGHAAILWIDAKLDPTSGRRHEPGYNQVFVDPSNGAILGTRQWGKPALDREHLLSFLYKLHYSLQLPEWGGIDRWGIWLMGIVALSWLFNLCIGLLTTLPKIGPGSAPYSTRNPLNRLLSRLRHWKSAWLIQRRIGTFRFTFDLHRAAGLWFLAVLLILAFTSFSLNLYREAFYPLMSLVSEVTPSPFATRSPNPPQLPIEPGISWQQLLEKSREQAVQRGWQEPVGSVYYSDTFGIHGVRFHQAGEEHGRGGKGVKTLYFDGLNGQLAGEVVPWRGTLADIFVQLQFPLHSGRILGLPGRILVSAAGLVIAILSITGIAIWWKKLRISRLVTRSDNQAGRP